VAVNTTVISDIVQISGGQCFNLGSKDAAELVLFTIWRWQFAAVPKINMYHHRFDRVVEENFAPVGRHDDGCSRLAPALRGDRAAAASRSETYCEAPTEHPRRVGPCASQPFSFVVFHYGPKERCEIFGGKRREVVRFQVCRSLEEGSTKLAQTPGSGFRALDAILSKTATNGR
jgi:hypothetical protein